MIVVYKKENPDEYLELFSGLKLAVETLGFKYNTLSKKTMPFEWRGYVFKEKEVNRYELKKSQAPQ